MKLGRLQSAAALDVPVSSLHMDITAGLCASVSSKRLLHNARLCRPRQDILLRGSRTSYQRVSLLYQTVGWQIGGGATWYARRCFKGVRRSSSSVVHSLTSERTSPARILVKWLGLGPESYTRSQLVNESRQGVRLLLAMLPGEFAHESTCCTSRREREPCICQGEQ